MTNTTPNDPPPPPLPQNPKGRKTLVGEQAVVVVQQPSMWRGILSWLGWMIAGLCLLGFMSFFTARQEYFDNTGGVTEKFHSLSKVAQNKIAVVNATGMITTGDGYVKKQIDRVRKDENVKGIVLRVDSPGGTVYGSDFILHHLKKLREETELPMVVSMGSVAASGGYYIAMAVGDQEDCIFAEPLTTTGSIGVIIPHYNVAGLMEDYRVEDDSLMTHPRKSMLSMTRPISDDHREVLDQYMGHAFDRFKDVIKEGRKKFRDDPGALDELATGEVFTAKQALESGLIDEIGFIEEAIDRVIEMANLDKDLTRVVTYKQPTSLMGALSLGKAPDVANEKSAILSFFKLNTQQAYYMSSPLANWMAAERD